MTSKVDHVVHLSCYMYLKHYTRMGHSLLFLSWNFYWIFSQLTQVKSLGHLWGHRNFSDNLMLNNLSTDRHKQSVKLKFYWFEFIRLSWWAFRLAEILLFTFGESLEGSLKFSEVLSISKLKHEKDNFIVTTSFISWAILLKMI